MKLKTSFSKYVFGKKHSAKSIVRKRIIKRLHGQVTKRASMDKLWCNSMIFSIIKHSEKLFGFENVLFGLTMGFETGTYYRFLQCCYAIYIYG
jgi:hypothetical protein